ncbi:VWA domain-containing protein [Aquabacterium sp. OR-4]|uniref:VWA domain-containing protein n=1 Tax=Aquabacterium sp. OR-4 TaxID=2978127 RepID=UPI0021B2F9DF|nr:VWA domain-containing protein [Aquabacterium sp. OR-4]MDT7835732.1 VWA domain-containing protein [Aquabacterium sp. OR-4]
MHAPAPAPLLPVPLPPADPLGGIAGFAATLREHGFRIGIAEQQALVQAALALPLARHGQLEAAWRAIACHNRRDWQHWPELFQRYWHPQRLRGSTRVSGLTRPSRDLRQAVQQLHDDMAAAAQPARDTGASDATLDDTLLPAATDPGRAHTLGGASRTDALHERRFSQWLPQDLAQLNALAERIAERLRQRLTRRWLAQRSGRRLDLRRTLRASLATGGVPLAPAWRQPRRERPRLFILVDVSRSMEIHAQLFLRIARAFVTASQPGQTRVFVFHTRLAEVTPLLQRDSATVQEKVNAVASGFGGGTRIATSVDDFVRVHARAQLGRRAQVWLLSDGFDADAPQALAEALARVRGRGARTTWFHPSPAAPASAAVQGARPHIERFIRLASLADLQAAASLIH